MRGGVLFFKFDFMDRKIREEVMKIDLYTKIVLTIIALCLVVMVIKDVPFVQTATAEDIVSVQIRGINEAPYCQWEPLPVKIVE